MRQKARALFCFGEWQIFYIDIIVLANICLAVYNQN